MGMRAGWITFLGASLEYAARVILDLGEARAALARTPSVLRQLVDGLPPEWLAARPADGEWSAHQVTCHLAYVEETDWMVRARMIREVGPMRPFPPVDHGDQTQRYAGLDTDAVAQRFADLRTANLAALDAMRLTDADLELRGLHPPRRGDDAAAARHLGRPRPQPRRPAAGSAIGPITWSRSGRGVRCWASSTRSTLSLLWFAARRAASPRRHRSAANGKRLVDRGPGRIHVDARVEIAVECKLEGGNRPSSSRPASGITRPSTVASVAETRRPDRRSFPGQPMPVRRQGTPQRPLLRARASAGV